MKAPTPSRASKRSRVSSNPPDVQIGKNRLFPYQLEPTLDPLDRFLADLASTNDAVVIHRLQVSIFVYEIDAGSITSETRRLVSKATLALLSHTSNVVRSWAMLLLAKIAKLPSEVSEAQPVSPDGKAFWESIWDRMLKSFYLQGVTRAACYLLVTLSGSQHVNANRMSTDLISIGTEIEIQGPPVPSDASCALLEEILRIAESDVRTYKSDIPGKVCSRIIGNWQFPAKAARSARAFGQKAQMDPLHTGALLRLFVRVSYGSSVYQSVGEYRGVLPDGHLSAFWSWRQTTSAMRDWFWNAALPDVNKLDKQHSSRTAETIPPEPRANTTAVRLIIHLRKTLETLLGELEEADDFYWAAMTLERFRSILDIVWLSIAFEAYADMLLIIRSERLASQAVRLLDIVLPRIQQPKWTLPERATLLVALSTMLVGAWLDSNERGYDIIIHAGQSSGIRSVALHKTASE